MPTTPRAGALVVALLASLVLAACSAPAEQAGPSASRPLSSSPIKTIEVTPTGTPTPLVPEAIVPTPTEPAETTSAPTPTTTPLPDLDQVVTAARTALGDGRISTVRQDGGLFGAGEGWNVYVWTQADEVRFVHVTRALQVDSAVQTYTPGAFDGVWDQFQTGVSYEAAAASITDLPSGARLVSVDLKNNISSSSEWPGERRQTYWTLDYRISESSGQTFTIDIVTGDRFSGYF